MLRLSFDRMRSLNSSIILTLFTRRHSWQVVVVVIVVVVVVVAAVVASFLIQCRSWQIAGGMLPVVCC